MTLNVDVNIETNVTNRKCLLIKCYMFLAAATSCFIFIGYFQILSPLTAYNLSIRALNRVKLQTLTLDSNSSCLVSKANRTIRIMFWTTYYGRSDWGWGLGYKPFENCSAPYNTMCEAVNNNQSLYNSSHAILMFMRDMHNPDSLPKYRNPDQTWIMYMKESPIHAFINSTPFNGHFNISMTYKKASEIYVPYRKFVRHGTRHGPRHGPRTPARTPAQTTDPGTDPGTDLWQSSLNHW